MDDVVNGAVELVRLLAAQAKVEILVDLGVMNRHHVMVDGRRLRHVLLDLWSNAIKYNKSDGSVSVCCRPCEVNRLRIEVRDTGPGIASDDLNKLFSPFTRLPATENISGTGLGLAVSKVLTEAMGGALGVSSEPGRAVFSGLNYHVRRKIHRCLQPLLQNARRAETPQATILYLTSSTEEAEFVEQLFIDDLKVRLIVAKDGATGLIMARASFVQS